MSLEVKEFLSKLQLLLQIDILRAKDHNKNVLDLEVGGKPDSSHIACCFVKDHFL